jgi:oligoendopeptidase F
MKKLLGVTVGLAGLCQLVGAAPSTSQSYSIDQSRYFATPEIEQDELKQRIDEASAFPSVAPADPVALYDYLQRADLLYAQLQRHGIYLNLRTSRDLDDQGDLEAAGRANAARQRLRSGVSLALHGLGTDAFSKASDSNPALKRYAYLMTQTERDLSHQLPEDQRRIVDELAGPAASNLWTLYEKTLRSTLFAKIRTASGELDAQKDADVLALDPDRSVRQAAWLARWDGYASLADIYATILQGIVRLSDRQARLQQFPDAPSRVYFTRELDRQRIAEALSSIESHVDLYHSYQRLRAAHISAVSDITDVRAWDLWFPAPGFKIPRMTLDESRAEALLALRPLGADYVEHFRQLLDPANGRLDIAAERGNRTNGGFSMGVTGVPSGLFIESYGQGFVDDTRVILHEGGHAIHRQFMTEGGIPTFYTRGPNWMSEAFAALNELLLYDHLYQTNTDPKIKAYYLRGLIDDITFQIFGSAEEGTLEQSIHDGVVAGRIHTAADLDALTLSIWNKYEKYPSEPEFAHMWMAKSTMFQDPLYLVNYLYAGLLATKMFDMVQHDPADFQKRYLSLLREGYSAPPEKLLSKFFGREMSQRELVDDSMRILQQRVQSLASIYEKLDSKR